MKPLVYRNISTTIIWILSKERKAEGPNKKVMKTKFNGRHPWELNENILASNE